jgi:hypothetical protein
VQATFTRTTEENVGCGTDTRQKEREKYIIIKVCVLCVRIKTIETMEMWQPEWISAIDMCH